MEQALIRQLKDGTLAPYRAAAKAKGRSLEAELREVIERNVPRSGKDSEYLLTLSERAHAKTLKQGSDSTAYIRWMRDTNAGRLPGSPPFGDDDPGR